MKDFKSNSHSVSRPISQYLNDILPENDDPPVDDHRQHELLEFWREQTGIAAPYTYPFLYQSGRLIIFCDNATWATQIRHQTPSLIKQLNESGFNISNLTPKVKPIDSPIDSISTLHNKPGRTAKPISSQNADAMKNLAEKVSHEDLGRALNRLATKFSK